MPVMKPLTVIDLFAGCGGMTQGFADQGFTPVQAVEWNLAAAATYAANFGEDHIYWGDIADFGDDDIPEADVVIGGPPCQGFSNLGSKDVDDPRNQLWKQYLRFVRVAQPRVFVVENVERFSKSAEYQLLHDEVKPGGMIEGYHLESRVLLAADFGVAQRRPRTILIGSRIGRVPLPDPTHSKLPQLGVEPWETVRSRIHGLPERPDTTDLPETHVEHFGRVLPGEFKARDLHFGRRPREMSLQRYDCVPPGGGRFDLPDELLPDCWRKKPKGTTDVMGRMRWDSPSLTIRTEFFKPEKGQYLHPQWEADSSSHRVNRVITHLEASYLQDFPESYRWCGSKIEIAKQIGNAVPVGLAAAIARHLRSFLLTDNARNVPVDAAAIG